MHEIPKHYPVGQIASALSVSPKTVFRLIESGKLKAVKIGQQWRVPEAELQAMITAKPPSNVR